jgi:CBS domain-containing protein
MSVRDFCRREVCTATAEESIREAAKRMAARGVGALVVVGENQRPIGMLTDRDIVMHVLRRRRDPDRVAVSEAMQRTPRSTSRSA